jgi:hypothetical protein
MRPEISLDCSPEAATSPCLQQTQSSLFHSSSVLSYLILSSQLWLRLPSIFPSKSLYPFPIHLRRAICIVHLIFFDLINQILFGEENEL